MTDGDPDRDPRKSLIDLPVSAKLVYLLIEHAEDPPTRSELANRSLCPLATIDYALRRLRDAGLIERVYQADRDRLVRYRCKQSARTYFKIL